MRIDLLEQTVIGQGVDRRIVGCGDLAYEEGVVDQVADDAIERVPAHIAL